MLTSKGVGAIGKSYNGLSILLLLFVSAVAFAGQAPAAAAAAPAADPVSSVTVQAGCPGHTLSLRFTNNVPQYVTANPQFQPLNFTVAACALRRGGFSTSLLPPIFFLRGTNVTVRLLSPFPSCELLLPARAWMPEHRPNPSGSLPPLQTSAINATSQLIKIPYNAPIGLYSFSWSEICGTNTFGGPPMINNRFTAYFWVIFNASPGSRDADVMNTLNMTEYNAWVLGTTDRAYFGTSTVAAGGVKDVTGRVEGGAVDFTLGPQRAEVYLAAMKLVDSAMAWTSAANSVTSIANGASTGLPSGWPVPPGKFLNASSYSVPYVLRQVARGAANKLCGQCMVYGAVGAAEARALGIPARMVTTVNSLVGAKGAAGSWTWNFHVWDEVWLNSVTAGTWSAFDPSRGLAFGHTAITPVGPSARTAPVFAGRFARGNLPPGGLAACMPNPPGCRSVAWVMGARGNRIDVTSAYVPGGLPDPLSIPGLVTVAFDKPSYLYGDNIAVTVTVQNPYPYSVEAGVTTTLYADEFEGINLEGPWPLSSIPEYPGHSILLPPSGHAATTFVFSPADYKINGELAAYATAYFGNDATSSAAQFTQVSSGLVTQVTAPSSVLVNQQFSLTLQVTNQLSTSVSGTHVTVFLPDYDVAAGPADDVIPSLAPGQTVTIVLPLKITIPGLEVLSMEAYSPDAGGSVAVQSVSVTG